MGWLGSLFKREGQVRAAAWPAAAQGQAADEDAGAFSAAIAAFDRSVAEAAEIVSREFSLRDSGELARRRNVPTATGRGRPARRRSVPPGEAALSARNSLDGELTPIEPRHEKDAASLKPIGGRSKGSSAILGKTCLVPDGAENGANDPSAEQVAPLSLSLSLSPDADADADARPQRLLIG